MAVIFPLIVKQQERVALPIRKMPIAELLTFLPLSDEIIYLREIIGLVASVRLSITTLTPEMLIQIPHTK